MLGQAAAQVLLDNWTGASTVPSTSLYPHQWSWDSAFVAIGLRHLSPQRARRELETLLGAQWADGRIPHIVFNPAVSHGAYFPSPDFWRSSTVGRAAGAPAALETSGIVQPPVHALAALMVHRSDPGTSRRERFLERVRPGLVAWHEYLTGRRDFGGHGLAAVLHPWETGMDNSPCWDEPLSRVEPAPAGSFRRADLSFGDASDRPTDLDYGRYVSLATQYRDHGYRDTGTEHSFVVEDPGFNALLIMSEYALADIAEELGQDAEPHRSRARRLTTALMRRLWDEDAGLFLCRDVRTGTALPDKSVTGLLPLMLPELPERTARALVRTMTGPHFGLGATTRLVPSYDLRGRAFDASRYWRGPAWFNINWLLERGLRQHGMSDQADAVRQAVLDAAGASDFAEYVDPRTGKACGTTNFSWTAAVVLDLLLPGPPDLTAGRAAAGRSGEEQRAGDRAAGRRAHDRTVAADPAADA
ncbi:MGH1-like glycoside hydrolase domain-containing protein [Streptomyces agglomeratus]|uniref:MGH1-like glycoside hydrolase domain-containing protein n=1 Tax=Streptomyces agglomeratus TaxID=285458 RepID=UPI000D1C1194|nr:trehalase family glycosidase [Streptomyces agglomeratus]